MNNNSDNLKEYLALLVSGTLYVAMHLRLGPDAAAIASGTFLQMLYTAPYSIGFTYLLLYIHRRLSPDTPKRPGWIKILRIFFTVGIFFGFFFALYEYGGGQSPFEAKSASEAGFWQGVLQMLRLH